MDIRGDYNTIDRFDAFGVVPAYSPTMGNKETQ
jgi:hypothetical protein